MAKRLRTGDKVSWTTSQGAAEGRVVREVKSKTRIKGHEAKASKAEPQFIVQSERSGKNAIHRPGALRKR